MGDETTCIILSFSWAPVAAIALTALIILLIKFRAETDVIRKDKIQRLVKYPTILLILTILSIPLWGYLINQVLGPVCGTGIIEQQKNKNRFITTFSDNTTEKNITFPREGSFNSEADFVIPKSARIISATLMIEHPPEDFWADEFYNLSFVEDPAGIEVNEKEHYVQIKTNTLDVKTDIELSGTKIYDDVYIRKGAEIIVPRGSKLKLIVKGKVEIESGAGINASGRPLYDDPKGARDEPSHGPEGSGGGGGSHGGAGGRGGNDLTMIGGLGGEPFGETNQTFEAGEDGARGGGSLAIEGTGYPGAGGKGGDAVSIEANKLVVEGFISADGAKGEDSSESDGTGGGGGGGGGSIMITANEITLSGKISASGGKGGDDKQLNSGSTGSDGGGGGGGGGRILLLYNQKNDFGTVTVKGGEGGISRDKTKNGESGKVGSVTWTRKNLAGMSLARINVTSIPINPDNLVSWKRFYSNSNVTKGTEISFSVLDASDYRVLCEVNSQNASAGFDISECASTATAIRLNAEFITINFLRTPQLYNWSVTYDTGIKDFEFDMGIDQVSEYKNPDFYGRTTLLDNSTIPDLSENINGLVDLCSCRGCTSTLGNCSIAIRMSSKSSGLLKISNLSLEYAEKKTI